ncbi:MAG: hydrolase [Myxococcales bacterium]|nr:hydrolase [Myxococcales bacterium]
MFKTSMVLGASCTALALGCTAQPSETQEIVDNLVQAGFLADDVTVTGTVVYVGRDAEVSLAASREMLQTGDSSEEQFRTNNLVSPSLARICINGDTFTGVFSTALDLAIQNYREQGLSFDMARTPSAGCSFTINAVIQPGLVGGSAGFPSGGNPFSTITIGGGLNQFGVDTIEHVITHEIGHTIGFRHSDFFNRSISCGSGGNEGDGGIGAILIPGTPSGAAVGESIMNSCFRATESGEFTGSDVTALQELYASTLPVPNPPTGCGTMVAGESLGVGQALSSCDGRFVLVLQSDGNLVLYKDGSIPLFATGTNGQSAHFAPMQGDGNFVLYSTSLQPLFSSGTHGFPGAFLALQDDGNLVIYRDGVALWSTGTHGN